MSKDAGEISIQGMVLEPMHDKFMMFWLSRSGEVRGMQWQELHLFSEIEAAERDFKGIWSIQPRKNENQKGASSSNHC